MNRLSLVTSNLWYVLSKGDTTTLRLGMSLAAFITVLWIGVMLGFGMSVDDIEASRKLTYEVAPLWLWSTAFLVYGTIEMLMIAFKISSQFKFGRSLNILVSIIGTMLWTMNVDLLVASRIDQGVLSIVAAQWALASASWWIFIRNCYGR